MSKRLCIEGKSGISGDMTVAALIDLGANYEKLREVIDSLGLKEVTIEYYKVKKNGILAGQFQVLVSQKEKSHHRKLVDILTIIKNSKMNENARNIAEKIFLIVAAAESKVHGIPIEEVHFHEVGAYDSIVDIVATAFCIDNLAIKEVVVKDLVEGTGTIKCAHGILPVPVPAVVNILSSYKIPVIFSDTEGEMITPTGAAIVAGLRTNELNQDAYFIEKIGIGAGTKEFSHPNILRLFLMRKEAMEIKQNKDEIWLLETNIDDGTGEMLGFVMEKLLEAGAKDVFYTSIYMKKNRPAYQLSVICKEEDVESLSGLIFLHTTTIGIRKMKMEREILERQIVKIDFEEIELFAKGCDFGEKTRFYPEYESVKKLCEYKKLSYKESYQKIIELIEGI